MKTIQIYWIGLSIITFVVDKNAASRGQNRWSRVGVSWLRAV